MTMLAILGDIALTRRGLKVRKTGHFVPLEAGTLVDIGRWLQFYRALERMKPKQTLGPKICFLPATPRPWYFAWAIAQMAGARTVATAEDADIVWYFDDATHTEHTAVSVHGRPSLNARCTDVSKTTIAAACADVFGYSLRVDPLTATDPFVEKSEVNGAHDGRIHHAPTAPRDGHVYQRLIDNRIDRGLVEDLRTTILGGSPVLVFRKRRPEASRFANSNSEVHLASLEDVFSPAEVAKIAAFADAIGLDAGGLDVLRDRSSGNLFIVDANKTDMGPPLALSLPDKLRATVRMAEELRAWLARTADGMAPSPALPLPTDMTPERLSFSP